MVPNPKPYVSKPGDVSRNVFCVQYGRCLDVAIERGWTGFTCRDCRAFAEDTQDAASWAEERLRCVCLRMVIQHPSIPRQLISDFLNGVDEPQFPAPLAASGR